MRYSILFVIALIAVSGFIAYFGDILGRRMGKKRLTLFSLRPKYTAIAVTTVTGMIIAGLALLTLIMVNREFKKVFTEGELIIAQNEHFKQANETLFRDNRSLINKSKRLKLEVALRKKEVSAARAEASKALLERAAAVKAVDALKKDIADAKAELARRKLEYEALKQKNNQAESLLKQKGDELAQLQAQMRSAEARLHSAEAKAANADATAAEAAVKLRSAEEQARQAETRLAKVNQDLQATDQQLQAKKAELVAKQKQIDAQLRDLDILTPIATDVHELRSGNLVLRQGDELARGAVQADQSLFGIKADLFSLLDVASERAAKSGAGASTSGRTVRLMFRRPLGTGSVVLEDDNACIEQAARAISSGGADAMVQVVCVQNVVAGEHVPAEFILYANKLVYPKGAFIASTTMDGRASEGRLLLGVIDFLQDEVAKAAVGRGVVPVLNYDPRTSQGTDRQRQLDGLMAAVDQIRSKRAKVIVDVYACADIRSADALNMDNLRFSVRKAD